MINNYSDFCAELMKSGFSVSGGNPKGIFSVIPCSWPDTVPGCDVVWHTGAPDTDPWEWRMRVLEERSDIAYGKVFFSTGGYITKEWYPYFLAARRCGMTAEELYEDGRISQLEKRVYDAVREGGRVPLHTLKRVCGVAGESSGKFERALTDLQMKLLVTICGRTYKRNKYGEEYGWEVSVFCTDGEFWGEDLYDEDITPEEAYDKIRRRVLEINPEADEKKIKKFISPL